MGDNGAVSELIDTTEMYLRTIFELEEEGAVALRARIAERLDQSGPTVSQTVARMERDGLLTVEGDRHLELTPEGHALARRVMRKHRLAERLLVDVIGLEWDQVHAEACRWEHVMSEAVERRLLEILDHPTESPYGNPIPGLDELGERSLPERFLDGLVPLSALRPGPDGARVVVRRIGEPAQTDPALLTRLHRAGIAPGAVVTVTASAAGLLVGSGGETAELTAAVAAHVFVADLTADLTAQPAVPSIGISDAGYVRTSNA
jgi:DtxR family transcriptional regulator, iron-dependent repressor